jgi:hypothetical protein
VVHQLCKCFICDFSSFINLRMICFRHECGEPSGLLRVFENRVLSRIFGPKRDEVTGDRRKLHNE